MEQTTKIVCVPPCLLCPSLQASKNGGADSWRSDILALLVGLKVDIFPLPCPEATFQNQHCGIGRHTHGVQYYENLTGFADYCQELASKAAAQINDLLEHNYNVVCICGIENSPTCAASYIYSHKGVIKRPGIFMMKLISAIKQTSPFIPLIGINRRFPKKALSAILDAISKDIQQKEAFP